MLSFFLPFVALLSICTAHAIPFTRLPQNIKGRDAPNLKTGSWLITYQPSAANSPLYKGPLRITSNTTSTFISGDLYNGTVSPNPADGSPILPRENYHSFLRATKLAPGSSGAFSLSLEYWAFKGFARRLTTNETQWADNPTDGGYIVDLTSATASAEYPDSQNYFTGTVKIASTGTKVGKFTMGWVSSYLRRITVEIGTAPNLEVPQKDTSGTRTWTSVFNDVGYDVNVVVGNTAIPEPTNTEGPGFWKNEQEHEAVLRYRSASTNFDKEWRYYLLVVRRMVEVARGAMIDSDGSYNGIPREGTCIASEWIVGTYPNGTRDDSNAWSDVIRGKKFVELHDAWFRTALHEVGHMFNLAHPADFAGDLMTDTQTYVDAGVQGLTDKQFPDNITPATFQFSEGDRFLMQHRPDTHVRPGWVNFGSAAQNVIPPPSINLKA